MYEVRTGLRIVQSVGELPNLINSKRLYLDVETTSFDDKRKAVWPYLGDRICGIAVTADDIEGAWYIPVRHHQGKKNFGLDNPWNLPLEPVVQWANATIRTAETWRNANVKFDAHFVAQDGISFDPCRLTCLTVRAKTLDTDRFTHGLKVLARDWLKEDTSDETRVEAYLKSIKSKDYGRVPADILGEYACIDVLLSRKLDRYIEANAYDGVGRVWEIEERLTPVLFDMEREGILVDAERCKIEKLASLFKQIEYAEIVKNLTGIELVDSNNCFGEIILGILNLPVVKRTDGLTGNPSFDKEAMATYQGHPRVVADERTGRVIEAMFAYRNEEHYASLFLDGFLETMDKNNRIHPMYNQIVRTGRMSCAGPNIQQQTSRSKELLLPDPGESFGSWDASQIEFRMMVHYCGIEEAIEAYRRDPRTDYHKFVAEMVGTTRKPAKTINFMIGFGAGKAKTCQNIAYNKDIMREIKEKVSYEISEGITGEEMRAARYEVLAMQRGLSIYNSYHEKFPEIRITSEKARQLMVQRGYVRNVFGRRRQLPAPVAHKAFNSLNQGCANDVTKLGLADISPRYNERSRALGFRPAANVHDEILLRGPTENMMNPENQAYITARLETPPYPFKVPLIWDSGFSSVNWKEAKGE